MIVPGLLLAVILGLLSEAAQGRLREWLYARPAAVFLGPAVLSAVFILAAWRSGAASLSLALLVLAYTLVPAGCMFAQGRRDRATLLDFAVILVLWLPLELAAGASLVPKPVQGYLHAVAYGISITLALWLFLIFRGFKGMRYRLPRERRDFLNPLAGFAVVAPLLIGLGLWLGFLAAPHAPRFAWWKIAPRYAVIFAATALPEEILFRGLIQNWLMQRFGANNLTLVAAGLIFGCAHLDNGPQALPNWRYMILATIAGIVFGKVFEKSSSVLSSASLHALVNTVKYAFL